MSFSLSIHLTPLRIEAGHLSQTNPSARARRVDVQKRERSTVPPREADVQPTVALPKGQQSFSRKLVYVVFAGLQPGIYHDWYALAYFLNPLILAYLFS